MLVQEQVAGTGGVRGGAELFAGQVHDPVSVGGRVGGSPASVGRPVGERLSCPGNAVRVARLYKVAPVSGHGFRDLEVVPSPGRILVGELQGLEDVFDFTGVTRAGFLGRERADLFAGLGFGNLFEAVVVDGRA